MRWNFTFLHFSVRVRFFSSAHPSFNPSGVYVLCLYCCRSSKSHQGRVERERKMKHCGNTQKHWTTTIKENKFVKIKNKTNEWLYLWCYCCVYCVQFHLSETKDKHKIQEKNTRNKKKNIKTFQIHVKRS